MVLALLPSFFMLHVSHLGGVLFHHERGSFFNLSREEEDGMIDCCGYGSLDVFLK